MIKLITLDLDNTLWDIEPIIIRAENALKQWLQQQSPELAENFHWDGLRAEIKAIRQQHPEIAHHPTEMRKKLLFRLFSTTGLDEQQAIQLSEKGFELFYQYRNQITLDPATESALQQLHGEYQLIALTNGNANLQMIGIDRFFAAHFSAETEGKPKPHAAMFERALTHAKVTPEQTVHVGDHPLEDVEAARALGFRTIWFNEQGQQPADACQPDIQIQSITELVPAVTRLVQAK